MVCRNMPEITDVIRKLDDPQTRMDVGIERIILEEVGGGCFTPQGIYCRDGHVIAEILALDGSRACGSRTISPRPKRRGPAVEGLCKGA